MKIKLSEKEIENIVADPEKCREAGIPEKCREAGIKVNDPWWVIMMKVLAYVIGLLLGGTFTTSCAHYIM